MQEIRNLERILSELEYLNTSILTKLENLDSEGIVKNFEKVLKKIKNSEYMLEKLEETSLILRIIFYAILADEDLVMKVLKVALKLGDDEVVEFLKNKKGG